MSAYLLITIFTGVFWTLTYILCIWFGFKNKRTYIPLIALCGNYVWEAVFFIDLLIKYFVYQYDWLWLLQGIICGVWLIFDILIIITYFKYGEDDKIKKLWYFIILSLVFVATYIAFLTIPYLSNDVGTVTAFLDNVIISIAFCYYLFKNTKNYKSVLIGIFKFLGTFLMMIGIILYTDAINIMIFCIVTGIISAIFDIYYILGCINKKFLNIPIAKVIK